MDPGWLLVTYALLFQCALVLLLVMPVPNNAVRASVLKVVHMIWDAQFVRFAAFLVAGLDAWYLVWTMSAIWQVGGMWSPIDQAPTTMSELQLFRNERNAFITGGNLFMFLVLRRLVDIQSQLRDARIASKQHEKVEKIVAETKKKH